MKNVIASLLLVTSIICCSSIASTNEGKIDKKHRYGEKILVLKNNLIVY